MREIVYKFNLKPSIFWFKTLFLVSGTQCELVVFNGFTGTGAHVIDVSKLSFSLLKHA